MAMKKSLRKRITLANKYIRWAMRNDVQGTGYFGSTWPTIIYYKGPLEVSPKQNVVTFKYLEWNLESRWNRHNAVVERFDLRRTGRESDLRYEINTFIIKAIKSGAKSQGWDVPHYDP